STCSSRVAARPSQNWDSPNPRPKSEGAWRFPRWPDTPTLSLRPSENACIGSWQLEQEIHPSTDKRLSKNRLFPMATLDASRGLEAGAFIPLAQAGAELYCCPYASTVPRSVAARSIANDLPMCERFINSPGASPPHVLS